MNILVKNGRLVDSQTVTYRDIRISGERIESVRERGADFPGVKFDEVIDAAGKYILPGIIDAHTHYFLESRGTVTADDFYSASVAGAIGGVTTAVDFADQVRGKNLAESGSERIRASERDMVIDFGLHQCIFSMPADIHGELKALYDSGITTVKIFTTYKREGYFLGEDALSELFAACRDLGIMVTAHCEDDDLIDEISAQYEGLSHPPSLHPVLRPAEAEYRAIRMIGRLAAKAGAPIYIVHLSSARGAEAVDELRSMGVRVVVETTPHYLLLNSDLLEGPQAQKYIMTPPLRSDTDKAALWEAVEQGKVQIVATDHCAFSTGQKMLSEDCRTVLPGIPGTEELLPLMHSSGVSNGRIEITRLVSLLSEAPAKYFGLYPRKGSLLEGTDADLVILDPQRSMVLEDGNRHTAAGYTPYAGTAVTGMPVLTMLRGKIIAKDGEFSGTRGCGRFVRAEKSVLFQ